jgi:hypothetical protein
MTGCGVSGAASNNQTTTPPDVTGNWYINATSSVDNKIVHLDGSIVDAEQQVAASLWQDNGTDNQNNSSSCTAGYLWVFSGTQSVTSLPLTTTSANSSGNGATIKTSLTSTSDGGSLTGTYSISGGCSSGDTGSVTGVRVPSLTGSWTGTIDGNNSETVSAPVTQASSPGPQIGNYGVTVNGDTYALTGTWQFNGNQCLGAFSGTMATDLGVVQGNQVGVTFFSNGTVAVPTPPDTAELAIGGLVSDPSTAKSMSLSYSIHGGACDGQAGTIVLSQ